MTKAAAKGMSNKGGKPAPFKNQGAKKADTVVVNPKTPNKNQKMNIDMLSKSTSGASPKKADVMTVDPKNRNKAQLANIKQLAGSKYGQGDNPYRGK